MGFNIVYPYCNGVGIMTYDDIRKDERDRWASHLEWMADRHKPLTSLAATTLRAAASDMRADLVAPPLEAATEDSQEELPI